jgi:hypothetical protein
MSRLTDWWRRLAGGPPNVQDRPRPATPRAHPTAPPAGLEIADAPPVRGPSRVGAAGFDPYASDAGFSKPHSWERVDHD